MESDDGVLLLILRVSDRARTSSGWPAELILNHVIIVLVVRQGALSDLDSGRSGRVLRLVKILSILGNVEHWGLSRRTIEQVREVLKADEDRVLGLGEKMNLEIAIEVLNWCCGSSRCRAKCVSSLGDKEGDWFINSELNLALHRILLGVVEELHVVPSVNLDTPVVRVGFIQGLANTAPVIVQETSVLHDFDAAILEDSASLGAIVHDSQLLVGGWASDGDGGVDGVVVAGGELISCKCPIWSIVKDTLLHLKAIRVSVECILTVEVKHVPVDNDLLAEVIIDGDTVKLDLPFNSGHAWLEVDESSILPSLFLVLVVDDKLVDTSGCGLVSLNLDEVRELSLLHITVARDEEVGARGAGLLRGILSVTDRGVVVLEGEGHLVLAVLLLVSDLEDSPVFLVLLEVLNMEVLVLDVAVLVQRSGHRSVLGVW